MIAGNRRCAPEKPVLGCARFDAHRAVLITRSIAKIATRTAISVRHSGGLERMGDVEDRCEEALLPSCNSSQAKFLHHGPFVENSDRSSAGPFKQHGSTNRNTCIAYWAVLVILWTSQPRVGWERFDPCLAHHLRRFGLAFLRICGSQYLTRNFRLGSVRFGLWRSQMPRSCSRCRTRFSSTGLRSTTSPC